MMMETLVLRQKNNNTQGGYILEALYVFFTCGKSRQVHCNRTKKVHTFPYLIIIMIITVIQSTLTGHNAHRVTLVHTVGPLNQHANSLRGRHS